MKFLGTLRCGHNKIINDYINYYTYDRIQKNLEYKKPSQFI
ncbi:IS3 family transposase [Candidatus Mycoplasma mahonii]